MVKHVVAVLVIFFGSIELSLAQYLEFSNVIKLSGAVNSEAEESMPMLSADGKKLFFARSIYDGNIGGRYAGQDVWISENSSGEWRKADNRFADINNKNNNVVIGTGKDSKILYYMKSSPSEKLEGIYFSKFIHNTWTKPAFIRIPGINNQDFIGFFVSPDFDVIFLSMRGANSHGEEDIYISTKNVAGEWSVPKNIGVTINTSGFEIAPFLSADKKRLYFSSNGHPGYGDADLFYSERLYDSWETWSTPVNLGEQVNSKKFDAYFSMYGDTVGYFTSNRDAKLADIYKVKVSQGSGILARGQRYLNASELANYVGKNVIRKIIFENKATTLNAAQKELLYYITNKVFLKKEVGFHIVVKEEENAKLTQERVKAIETELRRAGIEATRIYTEQTPGAVKTNANAGVIEIMLFK
jgi:hypothetical protein